MADDSVSTLDKMRSEWHPPGYVVLAGRRCVQAGSHVRRAGNSDVLLMSRNDCGVYVGSLDQTTTHATESGMANTDPIT